MSRYDCENRNVSRRVRKVVGDGAYLTSSCRQFHTWGPATENARLPTVEWWTGGWMRQSLQEERSPWRLGRSATKVNRPRCKLTVHWVRTKPLTCWLQVECSDHYDIEPHLAVYVLLSSWLHLQHDSIKLLRLHFAGSLDCRQHCDSHRNEAKISIWGTWCVLFFTQNSLILLCSHMDFV